jgi:hypothetical protein
MATVTVYADTSDGQLTSGGSGYDWLQAQQGTAFATDTGGSSEKCGIDRYTSTDNTAWVLFFRFNTASIGGNVVSAVTLKLYHTANIGGTITMEARATAWGTTLTDADWVDGDDDWVTKTLLATEAVPDVVGQYSYDATTAFAGAINRAGYTELAVCEENFKAASPTIPTRRSTFIKMADSSGTTDDPQLVIEYNPPVSAPFFGCNF